MQEWQTDSDDPGRQINKIGTPELLKAAKISLLASSNDCDKTGKPWTNMPADSIYGEVWAWPAMWARLGEGDCGRTLVRGESEEYRV